MTKKIIKIKKDLFKVLSLSKSETQISPSGAGAEAKDLQPRLLEIRARRILPFQYPLKSSIYTFSNISICIIC